MIQKLRHTFLCTDCTSLQQAFVYLGSVLGDGRRLKQAGTRRWLHSCAHAQLASCSFKTKMAAPTRNIFAQPVIIYHQQITPAFVSVETFILCKGKCACVCVASSEIRKEFLSGTTMNKYQIKHNLFQLSCDHGDCVQSAAVHVWWLCIHIPQFISQVSFKLFW